MPQRPVIKGSLETGNSNKPILLSYYELMSDDETWCGGTEQLDCK